MDYHELIKTLIKEKITLLQDYQADSLWDILFNIKKDNVPGVLVETGVFKGGAAIIMQFANVLLNMNKDIYLYDSFEGTPSIKSTKIKNPDFENHPAGLYRASEEQVINNFKRFNLPLNNVNIVKGWFEDTLPVAEVESIALLRFDGDVYSSTIDVLENLYHKVVPGGYIIIDDYCLKGCKAATDEFRTKNKIIEPMYTPYNKLSIKTDCYCASWWQKKKG